MLLPISGVVAALVLALPAPAQGQFEFTPFVGVMVPLRAVAMDSGGSSAFEHTTGTMYGAKLGYRAGPRIAAELSGGFGSSQLQIVATGVLKIRSTTNMVDLRLRYLLSSPSATNSVFVTAGAGIVDRRNALFDVGEQAGSFEYSTKIGFVVGLGATLRVLSDLALRVDVEDHIHGNELEGTGLTLAEQQTQHDIHISLGAMVPFGR
jgi:hypothetical protein